MISVRVLKLSINTLQYSVVLRNCLLFLITYIFSFNVRSSTFNFNFPFFVSILFIFVVCTLRHNPVHISAFTSETKSSDSGRFDITTEFLSLMLSSKLITLLFVLVSNELVLCCFSRFDIDLNKSSMFCVALLNPCSCILILADKLLIFLQEYLISYRFYPCFFD